MFDHHGVTLQQFKQVAPKADCVQARLLGSIVAKTQTIIQSAAVRTGKPVNITLERIQEIAFIRMNRAQ